MNKVVDIKTAIDKIRSGDSIMLGGFTNFGCPLHLLYELAKRPQVNNLTLISEDLGYGGLPYLQGPGRLFENEQVSKSITSFIGANPDANRLIFEKKLNVELVPQGTLTERIRAGGAGIGGFYTPTGVGTVAEEGKETKMINGKKHILELPLRANVALVKAYKADRQGNAIFKYTAANFNTVMATAADLVILEVEKLVETGEMEPDQVQLPGIFIDNIVLAEEAIF